MKPSRSLYRRLTLALLAPMLAAMAVAWAIGVGVVTQALEQRVARQSQDVAAGLAAWDLALTPELLRRLGKLQGADFVLLDRDGHIAVSTSEQVAQALAVELDVQRSRGSHPTSWRMREPLPGIAVYRPIAAAQDPRYSALVAVTPLVDARAAARRAALWLGLAALAATAVLAALLLRLVRGMTGPLGALASFADRVAAGERRERLPIVHDDEIGQLTRSLNVMVERLAGYEAELASRSRLSALGEMAAKLAHEVRNPLTGMKLHLQLLAERVDEAARARVQRLLQEVERLELLVSSTLLVGGERELHVEATDLAVLAADVLDLMRPSLEHRAVAVEIVAEARPVVAVDRARLRQALLNLLANAADAMPDGGRLRIGVVHDEVARVARVTVEDSGPGIDAESLRQGATGSHKPFGLGLGLAVCRDVAEAHGGGLQVGRSAALGGASVGLALPLPAPADAARETD